MLALCAAPDKIARWTSVQERSRIVEGNVMAWRFCRNMLLLAVLLLHGLHASRDAPRTYDDPEFINKMILVAFGFVSFAIAHVIQREEDKLKSTH
jgi:hypothetical protein